MARRKPNHTSRYRPLFLISAILFASSVYAQFPGSKKTMVWIEQKVDSIFINGKPRTYIIRLPPAYSDEKKWPLVIVLHGGGGNAESAVRMTGMNKKADSEGFIAVYPNGTGIFKDRLLTWNAGNCCGYALDKKTDDVLFIKELIIKLKKEYGIDDKRVFITGISNGGKMSYRLACELSDLVAAIAVVAGSFENPDCAPESPVSVIIFHGTADEHINYAGGKPKKQYDNFKRTDNSVANALSYWVRANGCNPAPAASESGNIIKEVYSGGKNNSEVVLYTIKDGRHSWPGGRKSRLRGADEPTAEISATDIMWEFFMRHPKSNPQE